MLLYMCYNTAEVFWVFLSDSIFFIDILPGWGYMLFIDILPDGKKNNNMHFNDILPGCISPDRSL